MPSISNLHIGHLFAQTNFDQILSFISSDYAEQIKTLLEWIGLTIAIGLLIGLIFLVISIIPKLIAAVKGLKRA